MKANKSIDFYLSKALLLLLVLLVFLGIAGQKYTSALKPTSELVASSDRQIHQPLVVFYGSSTVAGFGATRGDRRWTTLVSRYLGWDEMNEGVSGSTIIKYRRADNALWDTVSGVERWQYSVVNRKPDLVVMMYGANDTYRRLPLDLVEKDFNTILTGLSSALSPKKILVLTPQPNSATIDYRSAYDLVLKKGAEKVGAFFIDTGKEGFSGLNIQGYAIDGLHMNDLGHATLASFSANKIVEFGLSSRPPKARGGNQLEGKLVTLAGGVLRVDADRPLTFGRINNLEVKWGKQGEAILGVMRPDGRGGYDLVYKTERLSVSPGTSRINVPGWWVLNGDRLAVWTKEDCLLAAASEENQTHHLVSVDRLENKISDLAPESIKTSSYRLAIRTLE